jgi:hypothetical protein
MRAVAAINVPRLQHALSLTPLDRIRDHFHEEAESYLRRLCDDSDSAGTEEDVTRVADDLMQSFLCDYPCSMDGLLQALKFLNLADADLRRDLLTSSRLADGLCSLCGGPGTAEHRATCNQLQDTGTDSDDTDDDDTDDDNANDINDMGDYDYNDDDDDQQDAESVWRDATDFGYDMDNDRDYAAH